MNESVVPARDIVSVSALVRQARGLLETNLPMLWVEGEISNLARPASGHLYFTLKDEFAQVRCAMFRTRALLLREAPANGRQVLVRARVTLYEARGEFHMTDFRRLAARELRAAQPAEYRSRDRKRHHELDHTDAKISQTGVQGERVSLLRTRKEERDVGHR